MSNSPEPTCLVVWRHGLAGQPGAEHQALWQRVQSALQAHGAPLATVLERSTAGCVFTAHGSATAAASALESCSPIGFSFMALPIAAGAEARGFAQALAQLRRRRI